ncbi:NAD(P)H-hydrate dehydratase [Rhizobiaceae bacterium BDR2-2]|uniref:Bifunctional NAD(P)H-hydrate repair enzyme n=1 Tax=Ectorhizobium quercum TaxID=2965071 RepID=A0AAE3MZ72_9HYPH|nr:NAD(P)H-hydrate dehydratase [Ectorhizobium quercum]MCX8997639.1 NAD(P)H-hydrate dehydratase [Ectorhizobium quercum]
MIKKQAIPILSPQAMAAVDLAAARSGIDSYGLMVRAGHAVAAAALKRFPPALRFVVLAGPGNNGGDAYVAAKALAGSGIETILHHFGRQDALKGDAARAFRDCPVPGRPLEDYAPRAGDVVIDGLFGAGLDRPVPEPVAAVIARVGDCAVPVVAADLPSGVCGRTGRILGAAFEAAHTVTFMTPKPGHLLLPGRALCGTLEVFDIGIPGRLIEAGAENIHENGPALWGDLLPSLDLASYKFRRGHLCVFSGGASATGAARLSAGAALRAGAGLVTIAAPEASLAANAAHLTAVMLRQVDDVAELRAWIDDPRLSAFVLGPGFGVGEKARDFVLALRERRLVLDADGITSFADAPDLLFDAFAEGDAHLILTPHEGEFARLFPDIAVAEQLGKVEKARHAAARAHAVVIYKGADTVIAAPDGRVAINTNAPPFLATAGSGDVLAGIAGAFLAQGMPAFEAAAAAVWVHGEAGRTAGRGLTAEDLLPAISLPV